MPMIKLKVRGMSCEHCVRAVDRALATVDGVERVVAVDLEAGTAIIEGRPAATGLLAAIEEEGYKAEIEL